jgi:hypothetical protein
MRSARKSRYPIYWARLCCHGEVILDLVGDLRPKQSQPRLFRAEVAMHLSGAGNDEEPDESGNYQDAGTYAPLEEGFYNICSILCGRVREAEPIFLAN